MTRLSRGVDRTVTIAVGLLLVIIGVVAILWRLDAVVDLSRTTDTGAVQNVIQHGWWPWVSGAAGVLMIIAGLRWLAAHLPSARVTELNLPGTGEAGRLRFNASSAAAAAARQFAELPSVRSAQGKVRRDRGQLVVCIDATIDPATDLHQVAEDADRVVADLADVMGRADLYGRVRLKVSTAHRSRLARVT